MSSLPTVPGAWDLPVLALLHLHGLANVPQLVPVREFRYAERMCHLSSKHHAMRHGGNRVHGWALWRWATPQASPAAVVIIGEHHSVWENPAGELIDVTPPLNGSPTVLFVQDDRATINAENGVFLMRNDKTNLPWCATIFRGKPTKYTYWRLQSNAPEIVSYAASLNFDLANLTT